MLWWYATASLAGTCPEVPALVAEARAAFDDAEVDLADERLEAAQNSLPCQQAVVPTDVLLDLYRLHVLVNLAQQDREGAVYTTIRAVVTDPQAAPPAEYGPQLAELHATWSSRLSAEVFVVKVEGLDEAWVDGHRFTSRAPFRVLAGEHLLQWKDVDGFHSEVSDLSADYTIRGSAPVADVPVPPVDEPVEPEIIDDPPRERTPPRHRAALLVSGGVVTAAGGAATVYAWRREEAFKATPYNADQYGRCQRDADCWAAERAKVIRGDAAQVRQLYVAGYALAGVGIALVGVELFVLPSPSGTAVGVSVPW